MLLASRLREFAMGESVILGEKFMTTVKAIGVFVFAATWHVLAANAAGQANQPASMPTTRPATRPAGNISQVAKAYSQKIAGVLPKGWSIVTAENVATIRRQEPVEWYGKVSLPYHKDKAELKSMGFIHSGTTYTIQLVFLPPMTAQEAQGLKQDNERMTREYRAAHPELQFTKNGPPKEFTDQLHRVPDILASDCSVIVTPFTNGWVALYDDAIEAECKGVEQRVRDVLTPSTQSATQVPNQPAK
jgi:hypothetical protein